MLQLLDFDDNPNVGVFCRANDKIAFVRKGLTKNVKNTIKTTLDVKLVELTIADATIIGSLMAFNSRGAVVTDFVDQESISIMEKQGFDVCVVSDKLNAAGNDILVNDKGALVHPDIKDGSLKDIEKALRVPAHRGTIASLKTVGMAAVVTNKGLLCHPKATDEEKRDLEKIFGVSIPASRKR